MGKLLRLERRGFLMMIQRMSEICASSICTDFKHMAFIGLFLAVILLLLNLPRVSVWAVDAWNQRQTRGRDRD
ncbi:MAG: hypothetical protein JSW51_15165 [Gemmatimonadota bacterium]|nr:MAG: hypothetical protein JSW51_15165 [Gemmatimonadota bacterium]